MTLLPLYPKRRRLSLAFLGGERKLGLGHSRPMSCFPAARDWAIWCHQRTRLVGEGSEPVGRRRLGSIGGEEVTRPLALTSPDRYSPRTSTGWGAMFVTLERS